jgi:hypothetical protein
MEVKSEFAVKFWTLRKIPVKIVDFLLQNTEKSEGKMSSAPKHAFRGQMTKNLG